MVSLNASMQREYNWKILPSYNQQKQHSHNILLNSKIFLDDFCTQLPSPSYPHPAPLSTFCWRLLHTIAGFSSPATYNATSIDPPNTSNRPPPHLQDIIIVDGLVRRPSLLGRLFVHIQLGTDTLVPCTNVLFPTAAHIFTSTSLLW